MRRASSPLSPVLHALVPEVAFRLDWKEAIASGEMELPSEYMFKDLTFDVNNVGIDVAGLWREYPLFAMHFTFGDPSTKQNKLRSFLENPSGRMMVHDILDK